MRGKKTEEVEKKEDWESENHEEKKERFLIKGSDKNFQKLRNSSGNLINIGEDWKAMEEERGEKRTPAH